MTLHRRSLLTGLASGIGLFAWRADSLAGILAAARGAGAAPPAALASEEGYWGEIARAFDVDRTCINLNNGGCSPAPAAVMRKTPDSSPISCCRK